MIQEAAVILFLWTNPALNADSTVCTDLGSVRLRAVREATADTLNFRRSMFGVDEEGNLYSISGPGLPDSMHFTIPRRQGVDWWRFNVFAADTLGNESAESNLVRLDLGDGGPITGVDLMPSGESTKVEWFDVQGRLIDRPVASGVYFRRENGKVIKVVILR